MNYTIKGGLIGGTLLLIIFTFFWLGAAKEILKEMNMDFEKSRQCMSCEQDLDSLFECAINNCNRNYTGYSPENKDCNKYFKDNIDSAIEQNRFDVNNPSDLETINELINSNKKDFTFRHCGFKYPKYVDGETILVNEPRYKFKPFYLQSFFTIDSLSRGLDSFFGLGYFPLLFILVLSFPLIGAFIGWIYKKKRK